MVRPCRVVGGSYESAQVPAFPGNRDRPGVCGLAPPGHRCNPLCVLESVGGGLVPVWVFEFNCLSQEVCVSVLN